MFKLKPLPFDYDALAPVISKETLEYHHDKHHRAYVDKLNELISEKNIAASSLDELLLHASGEIYNNAGQIWNHDFYWANLCAPGSKRLGGALARAINDRYESLDNFKQKFTEAGAALFGSGWVWLTLDGGHQLQIFCGADADNPRRHGMEPLLTCDVWEHAYYIDYRNKRQSYLDSFWDIVNWKTVGDRYTVHERAVTDQA